MINTTHEYFRLLGELSTFYLTISLKKFGMRAKISDANGFLSNRIS